MVAIWVFVTSFRIWINARWLKQSKPTKGRFPTSNFITNLVFFQQLVSTYIFADEGWVCRIIWHENKYPYLQENAVQRSSQQSQSSWGWRSLDRLQCKRRYISPCSSPFRLNPHHQCKRHGILCWVSIRHNPGRNSQRQRYFLWSSYRITSLRLRSDEKRRVPTYGLQWG